MPFTFNGIGTKYYGHHDHYPDGSYIATEWFVIFWVPIIPLRSYRLNKMDFKMTIIPAGSKTMYSAIPVPLNKKQVTKTYIKTAIVVAILALLYFWRES